MSWLFPIAQHPPEASLTFSNVFSPDTLVFLLIQLILLVFTYMVVKRSSSTPPGVILTSNEYKEYIHLTQATKSASISSIAHTGNASAYLLHSSGPWILDSGASDHLFGNKDLFSSLTITSHLPMITLANGSQTMAKGIGSACPLPSVPFTYVIYVPNCPFNLISISKLTHDLNRLA